MKTIKELCDFLLPHIEKDLHIYSFFVCNTDWANAPDGGKVVEFSGEYKKVFLRALENANILTGVFSVMKKKTVYQSVLLFLQKN